MRRLPSLRDAQADQGVSLIELVVVVMIIGILASASVIGLLSVLRRERLNAVSLEIAGWIELVRNQAANEVRQELSNAALQDGGCTIFFNKTVQGGAGSQIASIDTTACRNVPYTTLKIPSTQNGTFLIEAYSGGTRVSSAGTQNIIFTPRGMILPSGPAFEYRLRDNNGGGPKRCVRIADATGTVQLGYGSDGNLASACTRYGQL